MCGDQMAAFKLVLQQLSTAALVTLDKQLSEGVAVADLERVLKADAIIKEAQARAVDAINKLQGKT